MKGLAESSPFHLLTNPHVINRFIFGHGVVIYYVYFILNNHGYNTFYKSKGENFNIPVRERVSNL